MLTRDLENSATMALPGTCSGEVKEGTGAGGAMFMASMMGFTQDQIQKKIFETVRAYG